MIFGLLETLLRFFLHSIVCLELLPSKTSCRLTADDGDVDADKASATQDDAEGESQRGEEDLSGAADSNQLNDGGEGE